MATRRLSVNYSDSSSSSSKTDKEAPKSLSLGIVTRLLAKGHEAKHRIRVRKLDKSMEMCGVQVAVRIRPLNKKEIAANDTVCVSVQGDNHLSVSSQFDGQRDFNFDAVLGSSGTQRKAYDVSARRVLNKVLDGFNGCVFAYGQTGSGKTYTMEGMKGLAGVIPRLTQDLFRHINDHQDTTKFTVRVSYVEVYQEKLRDLLKGSSSSSSSTSPKHDNHHHSHGNSGQIKLRQNPKTKTIELSGAEIKTVTSHADISKLMDRGFKRRTKAKTNMNEASSRSHAVLTLWIDQEDTGAGMGTIKSKLSLIDLAGSERQSKTGATGDRLKEGSAINKSLSALGNVVKALTEGQDKSNSKGKSSKHNAHVPYRDSTLTRLLQDSLGGNSVTLMICNIGPAFSNMAETLDSLRFAERAKKINNHADVYREGLSPQILMLMQQNSKLHKQLNHANKIIQEGGGGGGGGKNVVQTKKYKELESKHNNLKDDNNLLQSENSRLKKESEEMRKELIQNQSELSSMKAMLNGTSSGGSSSLSFPSGSSSSTSKESGGGGSLSSSSPNAESNGGTIATQMQTMVHKATTYDHMVETLMSTSHANASEQASASPISPNQVETILNAIIEQQRAAEEQINSFSDSEDEDEDEDDDLSHNDVNGSGEKAGNTTKHPISFVTKVLKLKATAVKWKKKCAEDVTKHQQKHNELLEQMDALKEDQEKHDQFAKQQAQEVQVETKRQAQKQQDMKSEEWKNELLLIRNQLNHQVEENTTLQHMHQQNMAALKKEQLLSIQQQSQGKETLVAELEQNYALELTKIKEDYTATTISLKSQHKTQQDTLQEKNDTHLQTQQKLEQQIVVLEDEKRTLSKSMAESQSDVETLSTDLQKKEIRIQQLNTEILTLNTEISTMTAKHNASKSALKNEKDTVVTRLHELEDKDAQLRSAGKQTTHALNDAKTRLETIEQQLKEQVELHDKTTGELLNTKKQKTLLEQERAELKNTIEQETKEKNKQIENNKHINKENAENVQTINVLNNEKIELHQEIKSLKETKNKMDMAIRTMKHEEETLHTTTATTMNALTEQISNYKKKSTAEAEEHKKTKMEFKETRTELTSTERKLSDLEHAMETITLKKERVESYLKEEKANTIVLQQNHKAALNKLKQEFDEKENLLKVEWPKEARETKRQLETQLHEQQDANASMSLSLETSKKDHTTAKAEKEKLTAIVDDLKTTHPLQIEMLETSYSTLQNEMDILRREYMTCKNEFSHIKSNLEHDCMSNGLALATEQRKLKNSTDRINEMELLLQTNQLNAAAVKEDLSELNEKYELASEQLALKTKEMDECNTQLVELRNVHSTLSVEQKQLFEQHEKVVANEADLKTKFTKEHECTKELELQLRKVYLDLEEERKTHVSIIASLNEEKEHVATLQSAGRNEIDRLMHVLQGYEDKKRINEEGILKNKNANIALTNEIKKCKQTVAKDKKKYTQLQADNKRLNTTLIEVRTRMGEAEAKAAEYHAEYIHTKESTSNVLTSIVPNLKKSLEEEMSRTNTLRDDLMRANVEIDRTHRYLKEERIRIVELRTESEEHARGSADASKRAEDLINKYEQERKELMEASIVERNQEMETEVDKQTALTEHINELEEQLNAVNEELNEEKLKNMKENDQLSEFNKLVNINADLRVQLSNAEIALHDDSHERMRLTTTLTSKESHVQRVQKELKELAVLLDQERVQHRQTLRTNEKDFTDGLAAMREQVRKAERKEDEINASNMKLKSNLHLLEDKLKETTKQHELTKNKLADATSTGASGDGTKEDDDKDKSSANTSSSTTTEIVVLQSENDYLKSRTSKLELNLSELIAKNGDLLSTASEKEQLLEASARKVTELEVMVNEVTHEKDATIESYLKKDSEKEEAHTKKLNNLLNKNATEYQQQEEELRKVIKERDDLSKQVEQWTDKYDTTMAELVEKNNAIPVLETEIQKYETMVTTTSKELLDTKTKEHDVTRELDVMHGQYKSLELELLNLANMNERLKQELAVEMNKYNDINLKWNTTTVVLERKESTINTLTQELDILKSAVATTITAKNQPDTTTTTLMSRSAIPTTPTTEKTTSGAMTAAEMSSPRSPSSPSSSFSSSSSSSSASSPASPHILSKSSADVQQAEHVALLLRSRLEQTESTLKEEQETIQSLRATLQGMNEKESTLLDQIALMKRDHSRTESKLQASLSIKDLLTSEIKKTDALLLEKDQIISSSETKQLDYQNQLNQEKDKLLCSSNSNASTSHKYKKDVLHYKTKLKVANSLIRKLEQRFADLQHEVVQMSSSKIATTSESKQGGKEEMQEEGEKIEIVSLRKKCQEIKTELDQEMTTSSTLRMQMGILQTETDRADRNANRLKNKLLTEQILVSKQLEAYSALEKKGLTRARIVPLVLLATTTTDCEH